MACVTSKCCFCAPLWLGLLAWAYIKLIFTVVFLWITSFAFFERILGPRIELPEILNLSYVSVVLVFTVMFVIGLHYRNYKFLFGYYLFSMLEVLVGVGILGFLIYTDYRHYPDRSHYYRISSEIILSILVLVGNILLPIYLIVLIRSQLLEIKAVEDKTSADPTKVQALEQEDKTYDFAYPAPESQKAVPNAPMFPVDELERMILQLGTKTV